MVLGETDELELWSETRDGARSIDSEFEASDPTGETNGASSRLCGDGSISIGDGRPVWENGFGRHVVVTGGVRLGSDVREC